MKPADKNSARWERKASERQNASEWNSSRSSAQREAKVKLNSRSVEAKAIKVQLLKFFVNERFDNKMIVRRFPTIPTSETKMMYGMDICIRKV